MEPISDEEFLATPLNVLANDPLAQTPSSNPSTSNSKLQLQSSDGPEPERSLEFDHFRQIKHADPYGRLTLGRAFAYQTFILEELTQGALLLRPAAIMEKRRLDHLCRTQGAPPTVLRIPTVR